MSDLLKLPPRPFVETAGIYYATGKGNDWRCEAGAPAIQVDTSLAYRLEVFAVVFRDGVELVNARWETFDDEWDRSPSQPYNRGPALRAELVAALESCRPLVKRHKIRAVSGWGMSDSVRNAVAHVLHSTEGAA